MLRAFYIRFLQCLGFDPRGIFSFHDGRRWRHVDPIEIARRYWSVMIIPQPLPGMEGAVIPPKAFEFDEVKKLIASGIGDQMQRGYFEAAAVARQAFDVKRLAEGGLTELECANLIERFENYLGDVKKNASGSPIWPQSMAPTENLPTKNDSDSGSTSIEKNSEPLDSSDLEPTQKPTSP